MSDKFKSATKLPELRVVLFIVFGVAVWAFLVAGMSPIDQGALAEVPATATQVDKQIASAQH